MIKKMKRMVRKKKSTAQSRGAERGRPPKGRRFKPGQSGNPGGLPKWVREVREFCGINSMALAREAIRIAKRARSERTRLAAIEAVLDRAGARPIQPIELSGPDGKPIQTEGAGGGLLDHCSVEELEALEALAKQVAARAAEKAGDDAADPSPRS